MLDNRNSFRKFLAERFGFAPPSEEEAVDATAEISRDPRLWGPNPGEFKARLDRLLGLVQSGAESGAGAILNAAEQVTGPGPLESPVPALREFRRNRDRELAGRKGFVDRLSAFAPAERATDLPTVNLDVIPGKGLNLPGDATLNKVDVGVKGALELAGDPLNLIGAAPKAAKAVREGAEATGRGAAKAGAALERRGFPSPISQADAAELTPEELNALRESGQLPERMRPATESGQLKQGQYGFGGEITPPQSALTPEEEAAKALELKGQSGRWVTTNTGDRVFQQTERLTQDAVDAIRGARGSQPARAVNQFGLEGPNTGTIPEVDVPSAAGADTRQLYLDPEGKQMWLTPEEVEIANRYKMTPEGFRNKAERLTYDLGREQKIARIPNYTQVENTIPVQRGLTTPRGETLTPSGRITKGLSEEEIARLPKVPNVPEPPRPDTELSGLERPPVDGNNIIGLKEINPGLTRGEKVENAILGPTRKFNKEGKLAFHVNDPYGTAGIREVRRVERNITSQAAQRSHREVTAVRQAFKLEDDAFVPSLAGKVKLPVVGDAAPSIQDIVDFYPQYKPFLTPAQDSAISPMVKTHEEYKSLLNQVGVGFPSRASTQLGRGHYISRVSKGLLNSEDVRGVPSKNLFAKAEKGFEEEIKFTTMAEGRAAGVKYAGLEEALKYHYTQAGRRAANQHLANYMMRVADDANWPIRAPRSGEMGRSPIHLPELNGETFPDAVAQSINKVIRSQGTLVGEGSVWVEAIRILNRGYRQVRATYDNSIMGIQMLLSAYSHPVAAASAAKVNFLAWKDKTVLTRFLDSFDTKAVSEGRLSANDWVSKGGVHLGAETGEFADTGLSKLPGFKRAGRAYGYTGDSGRLSVADALLEDEMHGFRVFGKEVFGKGRTLQEIEASGDLARIGEIANNMWGVSKSRTGGDIGELLLFAPRFLQSRLETVGKGLTSLRPGATIDQKIARRSLLKMMAVGTTLTVAINEMNGHETDFRPIVNGRKNPNFMRVRALGRDWSLFGTWDSLLGMFVAAGNADAVGVLRSQGSGITTATFDLLMGEDFVGRSTVSIENKARWLARQFTPFSGEQSAEGIGQIASGKPEDVVSGAAAAVGTFGGAKSSELSFTDHANEIAKRSGTSWDELRAKKKKAEDAKQDAILRGKPYTTFNKEIKKIDTVMDKISAEVDKKFPQDTLPRTLTVAAKREQMASDRYNSSYGKLYENQKTYINKLIAEAAKKKPATQQPKTFPPRPVKPNSSGSSFDQALRGAR